MKIGDKIKYAEVGEVVIFCDHHPIYGRVCGIVLKINGDQAFVAPLSRQQTAQIMDGMSVFPPISTVDAAWLSLPTLVRAVDVVMNLINS